MKFVLIAILFSLTSYSFSQKGLTNLSTADFNLQGKVREIDETKIIRGYTDKKEYQFQDTTYSTRYIFNPDGTFIIETDTQMWSGGLNCYQSLNTSEYRITQDTSTGFERAEKITTDSIDYEIHYRKYNEKGYLILDSIRYRWRTDLHTFEGPVTNHFEYDQFGNLIYHEWKSSFVFALKDWSYFIYKFDDFGNWIEKREYKVHKSFLTEKGQKKVTKKFTPKSITFRNIHYL